MRAIALFLLLTACGTATPDAPVNETDPAITDALNDPIMADPRLELQGRGGMIAIPAGIDSSEQARTLGQIAAARVREKPFAGCDAKIDYAFAWMARLPADLPLPPAATVSEAAGHNGATCKLRIVRYHIARPVGEIEAFYKKQGFTISDSDGTIRGIRTKDGAAFWVSVAKSGAGANVDFVTNRGP